jgi:PAS domain S-box-containing protein
MLGYEAGELVGQPSHATLHHTHEDGSAYAPGDCPAIMTQRDGVIRRVTGEVFWRKNGSSFPVEYSCTPVYEGDGRSAGTVVIFTDVTARKRAEAEVGNLERKVAVHLENEQLARRALAREQELNLIKSRFVRLVSHEFRTPLSVINGAAQLLSQYAGRMTEEECQQELKEIEQATGQMTKMMNDLLLHGRLEAGKMECHPAPVDVEMLCRQIIQETSHLTRGSNAVEFTLSPAARGAFLDRKIFEHILGHLLSNAVKYSLSGQPVRLEVERVDTQTPPAGILEPRAADYLEIKVSDSGIGIPAADMAKIFQTFHRAANVGNRPGTGMGLAIVKHFVELHRGAIRIQSQAGQGTCVTLWLPTNPN